MKYYFKENFHLIYADGQLYDENNDVAYEYENKTIFFPEIDLYKDGEKIGYVKKQFKWFLRSYDICTLKAIENGGHTKGQALSSYDSKTF